MYVLKENIGGNDASTELLIHSDGANGSTTFTDSSSNGFTITNIGSTTHMLGRSKINKTGINFIKELSQALSVVGHTNLTFGTGDFTIDFYISLFLGKFYLFKYYSYISTVIREISYETKNNFQRY